MSSATSSTPTLVDSSGLKPQTKSNNSNSASLKEDEELDYEKEVGRLKAAIKRRVSRTASPGLSDAEAGTPPDYADFEEEDIVEQKDGEKEKEWSPKFLRQQSHRSSASKSSNPKPNPTPNDPTRSPNPTGAISPLTSPLLAPLPLAPVPATPSLLHALDRVEKARREAFTAGSASAGAESQEIIGDDKDAAEAGGRGQRWEEFWREVKAVKEKDRDREGRR
ncbi:hypothetical protein BT96DRAFT_560577 [Gymnopus androsaceus JB14]|uniref:Uncharacterized protein n=1 Tax=Gymnopus androsaceus JB14 TaxID=1447944 RepID=A0A6A4GK42_9AGAR|nr:hypothetical protein BT96DRAFT_560577 [Gymnopus androsaceus JB14]